MKYMLTILRFTLMTGLGLLSGGLFTPLSALAQGPTVAALKAMTLEELMNLEVTSVSRRPERLIDAASAVQVITQEDIRRSGASSIPEALRLASNLEVAQIDARQWAISARGFNSTTANKMLVLIDGRTVYTPLYAGVFWDVQDTVLEDIDRIEVVSGPGASVWGSNAVNGVINIITKPPALTQGFLLSGRGGTELRGQGSARYGGSIGTTVRYRVYGTFADRDGGVLPSGRHHAGDWDLGQVGFRGEWTPTDRDSITLQGDLYSGRAEQPAQPEIGLGGGNVLGRWEHRLSESSDFKLQFYYDRANRRIPASFSEGLDTWDVDGQYRFRPSGRHDFVLGLAYRLIEDRIVNGPQISFYPPDVSRQWFSGFVQDEIRLVEDRLSFTAGMKIEHNDYTHFEFQPTARLAWKIHPQHSVWTAFSRAIRAPSRIDREFFLPAAPPFSIAGGANFRSEELLAYELGYKTQLHPAVTLSAAGYFNDYHDLRSIERLNPPQQVPAVIGNGLQGESYGVELRVDARLSETWRIRTAYSPLKIDFRHNPGSTDANPGTNESHDSDHRASATSFVDLPGGFEFDTTFRYVSRIANLGVPGYGEMDGRLGWQATPGLEISVIGQNLVRGRHLEFTNLSTRTEIQRSLGMRLVWSF